MMPIMLPSQFTRALRHHGPALRRWPEPERRAALRLLRLSSAARRLLADSLEYPGMPAADAPTLQRMRHGLQRRLAPAVPAAAPPLRWAALAACALAGTWLGVGAADQTDARDLLAALQVPPIGQVAQ